MALGDPYVTGDELNDYIPTGTTADAAEELDMAVAAASRWVEGFCRRQFNKTDTASARLFTVTTPHRIWVDDIATDTVTVSDGTDYSDDWAADELMLEASNGISYGAEGWPYTAITAISTRRFSLTHPRLVQVTATWGWPAVPTDVKQATLIQAGRIFKRRESLHGVLGSNDFGTVRVGTRVDPDVADLLARYRLAAAVV